MSESQVEPRTVTLYPEDWEIVDQVAQSTRQRSRSGALRFIIAEYQRLRYPPAPPDHEHAASVEV